MIPREILVILIILYVSIMGVTITILIQRNKKINLEKYRLDIKYGADPKIESLLDYIIDSVFDEYKLYNLEFRDDEYIKETDEQNMIKEVSETVIDRLSPVFIRQLSTYFNSSSLGSVIASKIAIKVVEYRIQRNTGMQNKK